MIPCGARDVHPSTRVYGFLTALCCTKGKQTVTKAIIEAHNFVIYATKRAKQKAMTRPTYNFEGGKVSIHAFLRKLTRLKRSEQSLGQAYVPLETVEVFLNTLEFTLSIPEEVGSLSFQIRFAISLALMVIFSTTL